MTSSTESIHVMMMVRELNLGGIERDVSKFARHIGQYGIIPHVACFYPGGARWAELSAARVNLVPVPVRSLRSPAVFTNGRMLAKYIRSNGIQVFHAFDTSSFFGVPVARWAGVPVTIESQLCYRELVSPGLRLLLPALDRMATGLFVNCQAIADHLSKDWKIARENIHLCYNGFEPEVFHPQGRKRPEFLADASVVIGAVAVLREEKNLSLLLRAFARVLGVDPRARLVIVGSGPLEGDLRREAADLGLGAACRFEKAVSDPADWMRALDVFVLSSRSEAFSNALLEAMACGCCPVGSRVGGTPELISHGERGLLFDSGNLDQLAEALVALTKDRERRLKMAENAVSFVQERLTIQIAASRLASIYRSLLFR